MKTVTKNKCFNTYLRIRFVTKTLLLIFTAVQMRSGLLTINRIVASHQQAVAIPTLPTNPNIRENLNRPTRHYVLQPEVYRSTRNR